MSALRVTAAALAAALRRPPITGVIAVLILLAVVLAAALSPLGGYPIGADVDPASASQGPSAAHWLGTDHLGRDVAWRLALGSRAFVGPGAVACLIAAALGIPLGAVAGFAGGGVAGTVRFLIGSVASVPRLVLILLICTVYGAGPLQLAVGAGIAGAPALAEAVGTRIEALRSADFVLASRAHGVTLPNLLLGHLVGAATGPTIARLLLATFGGFVILESTLSYIGGLGVPEPNPSWGNMLVFDWGRGVSLSVIAPALAIWLTVGATTEAGKLFTERHRG